MSTLKVEIVAIDGIIPHPNADKLDLAQVKGWQCVVQKDTFKIGDEAVYFPIDSILSEEVADKIFSPEAKVKLLGRRIKTIKLRGAISQGLLVPKSTLGLYEHLGSDVTEKLGVKKYEPPIPGFQSTKGGMKKKDTHNPNFHRYTSIENINNYNKLFSPDDVVVITEKIHGTSARFGWVRKHPKSRFEKILQFLELLSEWEFVVGSHNIERKLEDNNVYSNIAKRLNLKTKLEKGEVLYGEIYGPSIQKGYHYGCKKDEVSFVAFDLMRDEKFLSFPEFRFRCQELNLPKVPVLFSGPLRDAPIMELIKGASKLYPEQSIREGFVIKPKYEQSSYIGRKILKAINPEYLLKNNTEFH
jgi:RNA ligase (TIGR02306 family)